MDTRSFGLLDFVSPGTVSWEGEIASAQVEYHTAASHAPDAELLRRCGWEIGEEKATDAYAPADNHIGLAAAAPIRVSSTGAFRPEWVEQTARQRGAWHHCRLVLRLYDVSYIQFTGFNANRIQDEPLPGLCGQRFFPPVSAGNVADRRGRLCPARRRIPSRRSLANGTVPPRFGLAQARSDPPSMWMTAGESNKSAMSGSRRISCATPPPKLRHPLRIAAFTFALGRQTAIPRRSSASWPLTERPRARRPRLLPRRPARWIKRMKWRASAITPLPRPRMIRRWRPPRLTLARSNRCGK